MKLSAEQNRVLEILKDGESHTANKMNCRWVTLKALQTRALVVNDGRFGEPDTFGHENATITWRMSPNANSTTFVGITRDDQST
ncbi:MAG: hypothetical protein WBL23_04195 [Salinisphaera sp.]|uniref:hypothetical protein n=1 Tax=Salinisphaera sp. TaxID=1914330 RepID=UPI003C7B1EA3